MHGTFDPATMKISPVTYEPMKSFYKTQARGISIEFLKCKKEVGGTIHRALSTQKAKVSPNAYDPAKIDRGFKATTLGLSRGWK